MKIYKNDEEMIDELYDIMNYIHTKYKPDTYMAVLGYELEEVIIKIREEIDV